MTTYKTPGVYIEEIVKFPPSVAQVETAIPAFIGYTEKATNKITGDLKGIPTRITSMLEYETYFGLAKPETTIDVTVSGASIIVDQPSAREPFLMYYSLQMYFVNGGGPCYIVSVGRYGDGLDAGDDQITSINNSDHFVQGLADIRKVDEPTLLLFPDATALSTDTEFYSLYNAALTQCKELQDRFTIIDTRSYDGDSPTDPNIQNLRDEISSEKDFLKYGAAYYPYLKTILNYRYNEDSVEIQGIVTKTLAEEAADTIDGIVLADLETLLDELVATEDAIDAAAANDALAFKNDLISNVENVFTYLNTAKASINNLIQLAIDSGESLGTTTDDMTTWMDADDNLEDILANLQAKLFKLQQDDTKAKLLGSLKSNAVNIYGVLGITDGVADTKLSTFYVALSDQKTADELFLLKGAIDALGAIPTGLTLADLKVDNNALYNQILTEIGNLPLELPPSSAMAGIYARVDSDRGVWKAPANVSLSYVIEPSVQVSHDDQRDLNVDVVAGKSINAIRSFIGKGNLVWGARTLAGNDNEWRYISVRRFFNMAEESIKKATEQFVFEPNDKNTWVRVKAMIDNFLTQQWRAGALAGPAPDKAFYVNVGLGETMTAQDILEGNMIIEIGMAVVRPAEFIILKFSHKMQEA